MSGKQLLIDNIPELFQYKCNVLYVGASRHRFELGQELGDTGHKIVILERYYPNAKHMATFTYIEWVIYGDVLDIWKHQIPIPIDVCIWWHGPEHVTAEEFSDGVLNLEVIANSLVVLASPWGRCPQGDFGGNPFEVHRNSVYPRDYEKLGYNVLTCGAEDKPPKSDIVAWKWVGSKWWD